MAPEQARGELQLDARADVFALGCVLFECLTGRAAFEGVHSLALMAKILLDDPERVRVLRREVPASVDDLVARMLSKDPAERPADAAALGAHLRVLARLSMRPPAAHTGAPACAHASRAAHCECRIGRSAGARTGRTRRGDRDHGW